MRLHSKQPGEQSPRSVSIIKELLFTYYWGGEGQQLPGLASYVWRANCQEGLSAVQMKSEQQAPKVPDASLLH